MDGDPDTGAAPQQGGGPEADRRELGAITDRLHSLARELDSEPDEQRAAELVREASELAAEAGRAVESAVRAAAETREA